MSSFSIVTVVYNDVTHIRETMDSIINQTHQNIEYIIIDGGSTDGTKEAILEYIAPCANITKEEKDDTRLYLEAIHKEHPSISFKLLSEKDKGIYDAMNKGITLATKEWINFMNCGDRFYDLDVLEKVAREDIAGYDVVYGDLNIHYIDQNIFFVKKTSRDLNKLYMLFYAFGHPNCFIKTKVHQKKLFNPQYKLAADYDLIYKLYKQKKSFYFIDTVIATFSSGGASDRYALQSLNEALKIALSNNQKNPIMLVKIYSFYFYALFKKIVKLYIPSFLSKFVLKTRIKL